MSLFFSVVCPLSSPSHCVVRPTPVTSSLSNLPIRNRFSNRNCPSHLYPILSKPSSVNHDSFLQSHCCAAAPSNSGKVPDDGPDLNSEKNMRRGRPCKKQVAPQNDLEDNAKVFPSTIPRKPRWGRRSEAAAVEDFVRSSLEKTFVSIREKNPDICIEKERIFKERLDNENSSYISDDDSGENDREAQQMVVEEDNPNWPLDADIGWGIKASEYFEKHAINNVIGEDGTEIDWEGELDDNWVQEINCLEWESFAFHPSPLVVLVFERYNRATDNWKVLKELEKALKVYWGAKDRLPPRAVKLDINIERDLAYALKVRECPQILFLRGHRILYREKEFRTADDLVHMIAFFYYNAKKPSWIDEAALAY